MNTYEITYFFKKSYSFETILIDSWSREEAIDIFCAKTGLNNGCIVNIDNLTELNGLKEFQGKYQKFLYGVEPENDCEEHD